MCSIQPTPLQVQLSTTVSSQLHNITMILNPNLNCINKDLEESFCNQNLMYNGMETPQSESEQRFAIIEAQLARLGLNLEAPIVQSPQPRAIQYQAVLLVK